MIRTIIDKIYNFLRDVKGAFTYFFEHIMLNYGEFIIFIITFFVSALIVTIIVVGIMKMGEVFFECVQSNVTSFGYECRLR